MHIGFLIVTSRTISSFEYMHMIARVYNAPVFYDNHLYNLIFTVNLKSTDLRWISFSAILKLNKMINKIYRTELWTTSIGIPISNLIKYFTSADSYQSPKEHLVCLMCGEAFKAISIKLSAWKNCTTKGYANAWEKDAPYHND